MNKIIKTLPQDRHKMCNFGIELGTYNGYVYYSIACNCEEWINRKCVSCETLPDHILVSERLRCKDRYLELNSDEKKVCCKALIYRGKNLESDCRISGQGKGEIPDISHREVDSEECLKKAKDECNAGKAIRMEVSLNEIQENDVVEQVKLVPHRWLGER